MNYLLKVDDDPVKLINRLLTTLYTPNQLKDLSALGKGKSKGIPILVIRAMKGKKKKKKNRRNNFIFYFYQSSFRYIAKEKPTSILSHLTK